jgi:lipopolysaccharide/colanic/teichoic acid biosynthesis glycosyltransferase
MSHVGPSSFFLEYLECYTLEQSGGYEVKYRITGLQLVNSRNNFSCKGKFRLVFEYVKRFSFFFDYKISLIPLLKV